MNAMAMIDDSMNLRAKRIDFGHKAHKFLGKYWKNIRKEACDWWKIANEDWRDHNCFAYRGNRSSTSSPMEYDHRILALIAVILMNAGLNPVCETKTKEPLH